MHICHGLLHGMQVVALDRANSFDCCDMASIGSQDRHEACIHRNVPVKKESRDNKNNQVRTTHIFVL
jgi:hypothetical protein